MSILFATQLTKLSANKGLSQADIADKLLVPQQTVSAWEAGVSTPDLTYLVKLAEILDCSLDELVLGLPKRTASQLGQMNFWDFATRYWWLLFAIAGFAVWMIHYLR